ncbi:serine/threonine-protein kinase [Pyxidicoccus sp. MSG2]|uniref:serine/threonine-protein kinase n=1 Tax=Pyxidicoccus sp. MSG2 TaxID=2996790 RepID=UPI00226F7603|nr:serine/threonine-protein kinase [Pyxidicoccus sp. MSG2]MCY1022486.1 serine/threonine-protein kinase [Pyxidicoccus sp. MSG2]
MSDEVLAGRYQLEQELGRGGMATVFLAMDLRLSRRVAVKVMHPGEDGRRSERFRREAELAASLKHPNVLEVHDFGEDAVRGPFLVCEWVQGESLRELARRLAPVPPEVAAVLGWELARALEAAHSRGVVHRDVKPENVLVSKGGPLKLADFGIAALADQERLTSTGAVTGSLAYMAPERIDTGAWSPASDVYAVGVILFELCTGTTPHAGQGSAHLAVSVMTRDAPPLCEVAPGTPEPFGALVDRCLARDPRARPVDGVELAACLEAAVQQLVGPPSEASRRFFLGPEAYAAGWREARFQRLLTEGRALLSTGEGARAARLLNEALTLKPGSSEVLALLRARPKSGRAKSGRAKVLGGSALLVGLLGALVLWGWHSRGDATSGMTSEAPVVRPPAEAAALPDEQNSPEAMLQDPRTDALEPAPPEPPTFPPIAARASRTEAVSGGVPRRGGTSVPAGTKRGPPRSDRSLPAAPGSEAVASEPPASDAQGPATQTSPPTGTPPPQAQGYATLSVVTRPWAEVFVDGQSRGYTPRVREVRLTPGTHRLRFDNPLCDVLEEDLHVAAGETVKRELVLQVRKAEVVIFAPEGARVFVDGTQVGVAPLREPVKLTHGSHVFSARGAAGEIIRKDFDVVAGERTEVDLGGGP